MEPDENGMGSVDGATTGDVEAPGAVGGEQDGYDLSNALHESQTLRVGETVPTGGHGNAGGGVDGSATVKRTRKRRTTSAAKRAPGRPRKIVDDFDDGPQAAQASASLLTESFTEQADAAAEMILNTLNGIAVRLAPTPDAAMSILEQIMIQSPLSALLAKPTVIKRVASNAPYVALIAGFAIWGDRVAQLRQGSRPVSMPEAMTSSTNGTAPVDEFTTGSAMPDTGPIWDELASIHVG